MKLTLATNEEVNVLYSQFKKFNVHLLEEPHKLFKHIGIMDVYNRVLTEEEANKLLGFKRHHIKHGYKFLNTFRQLFDLENDTVYVHLNKSGLSKDSFKHLLESLKREEARLFRKLFSIKKGIYKVDDEEALNFLVHLSVNELYFTNFLFPSFETVILGNYDLSFPVYSKTMIGFQRCKEIIEQNGLFIRMYGE
ncbi:hypothetical protein AM499_05130 [Bacillus sp. FJAT-22090]|uniref:hypothetical protein n=1 Tax=Bacillus sp. FJAT-22090 TaxID=1581038 RepID=UPI0006AFD7DF|nr:hypothetical protein [Bacillus sp. FJAT-22090]ALC85267.1 hypothetical protein AM499_05130 [Bacillus sp. FJAT-22090]